MSQTRGSVKQSPVTNAEWERIRRETRERDAVEPRAANVYYNTENGCLVIELKSGVTAIIPSHLLQGVAGADPKLIAEVETDKRGYGLHWETLDADLTVPGLIAGYFGSGKWMDTLHASGAVTPAGMGRKGGAARTAVKSAASRENGKKGGRPRKVAA